MMRVAATLGGEPIAWDRCGAFVENAAGPDGTRCRLVG
jgi:hypothetical protein